MEMITQVEQSLIGSMLLNPRCIQEVFGKVAHRDFSNVNAGDSFLAIVSLWKKNAPVDVVTVASSLSNVKGTFLTECIGMASPIGAAFRAERVACAAKDRRVTDGLKKIAASSSPPEVKLDGIMAIYQEEAGIQTKNAEIKAVLSRFDRHSAEIRERGFSGYPTGFDFLGDIYAEYIPGHLWTIGAATSVGKTATMIQKICNLLQLGECPQMIVVSTEMTEEQLVARILANFTGVHSQRILTGQYRHGEEETVAEYRKVLETRPLMIFDDTYFLHEIESVFHKAALQGGVDIGFIDYVQNCKVQGATGDYQAQSSMAKGLQKLAKDVRCTLVCLSQVSNDVARGNTENLELKGAGEWAAVSDVSVHLTRHKDEKYLLRYTIKKNRHGALVDHMLEYKMDFTRLEPLKPYDEWKGK